VDDSKEFPVMNIIPSFGRGKGMEIVANGVWKASRGSLEEDSPQGKLQGVNLNFKGVVIVWVIKCHVLLNE
jgi:hypothetical protein